MRTRNRCFALITLSGLAAAVAGCGTPKEMTAPCKRPANLLSYASEPAAPSPFAARGCGPMLPVNTGPINSAPDTAIDAIDGLTVPREPG